MDRETKYRIMVETLEKEAGAELERNAKMKADYARLQRDLNNERKGLPSELELVVSQKDSMIGHLQQELAKLRSHTRISVEREASLEQSVQELQGELQFQLDAQAFRSRQQQQSHTAAISALSPSPKPSLKLHSPGSPRMLSTPSQSLRQRNSLMPHSNRNAASRQSVPQITDAMFEPEEAHHRLSLSESPARVSRGDCPHCSIPLTPFEGTRFGTRPEDSEKVAFCFSCRRSFTGKDLRQREPSRR